MIFCLWYSPESQIKINLIPAHGQNVRLAGTGKQAQIHIVADVDILGLAKLLEELAKFFWMYKTFPGLCAKLANSFRRIVTVTVTEFDCPVVGCPYCVQ